jgi:hypothetical protein
MIKLDLNKVASDFETISSDTHLFYNTKTGEFEFYGNFMDNENTDSEKYEDDEWIAAPRQSSDRDYDIMEAFVESVSDKLVSEFLGLTLQKRNPFRLFKDALLRVGLRDEWFAFRHKAFVKIAREWCIEHDIEYIDTTFQSGKMPCKNVKDCTCPKTECPNHKKCCDCVIKHREGGNLPFCLRSAEA